MRTLRKWMVSPIVLEIPILSGILGLFFLFLWFEFVGCVSLVGVFAPAILVFFSLFEVFLRTFLISLFSRSEKSKICKSLLFFRVLIAF